MRWILLPSSGLQRSRRLRKTKIHSAYHSTMRGENQDRIWRNAVGSAPPAHSGGWSGRPGFWERILRTRETRRRTPSGDTGAAEAGHPADQEAVAAPHHATVQDRVDPDGKEQDVLGGAIQQVFELGIGAAQPAGLDGVAHDTKADQHDQPAPCEFRVTRKGPDQPDASPGWRPARRRRRERQAGGGSCTSGSAGSRTT